MTDSIRNALAALFQHHGQALIRPEQAKLILCYQLNWTTPPEVDALLEKAVSAGLLKPKNRNFETSFDYTTVTVPKDFTFDPAILAQPDESHSLFEQILNRLSEPTNDSRQMLLKHFSIAQRETGLRDIELEGLL